jgi:hypothetical protein
MKKYLLLILLSFVAHLSFGQCESNFESRLRDLQKDPYYELDSYYAEMRPGFNYTIPMKLSGNVQYRFAFMTYGLSHNFTLRIVGLNLFAFKSTIITPTDNVIIFRPKKTQTYYFIVETISQGEDSIACLGFLTSYRKPNKIVEKIKWKTK